MTRMRIMNTGKIVTGQQVKPAKVEQARRLRRRMTEEEKILLMARGLRVVRFKNEEVQKDVARVLERIEGELPNPPAPFPEGKGEKTAVDTEFPLSAPERGSGGEVYAFRPGRVPCRERVGAGFADWGEGCLWVRTDGQG